MKVMKNSIKQKDFRHWTIFGVVFALRWSKDELFWTAEEGGEKRWHLIDISIVERERQKALQIILLNLWLGVAKA